MNAPLPANSADNEARKATRSTHTHFNPNTMTIRYALSKCVCVCQCVRRMQGARCGFVPAIPAARGQTRIHSYAHGQNGTSFEYIQQGETAATCVCVCLNECLCFALVCTYTVWRRERAKRNTKLVHAHTQRKTAHRTVPQERTSTATTATASRMFLLRHFQLHFNHRASRTCVVFVCCLVSSFCVKQKTPPNLKPTTHSCPPAAPRRPAIFVVAYSRPPRFPR